MRLALALATLVYAGTVGAKSWELRFPGFRTMNFPERTYLRLVDLNLANDSFGAVAERLHHELTVRVDTRTVRCEDLLASSLIFRTARQILTVLSYLDRAGTVPASFDAHLEKLMSVAIYDGTPKNGEALELILDEWIGDLAKHGGTAEFQGFFSRAERMLTLWEFATDLKLSDARTEWGFRDFFPTP